MSDDQFEDLKQFIDTRVSQSEVRLETKIEQLRTELRAEMHDDFAGIGAAIEDLNTRLDESNADTDVRLTKLEQQAA